MAITPVQNGAIATTTRTDRGLSSLSSEDFFNILVTELQQQDPFEPAKTADMIGQVSQIRSIELSHNLSQALGQISQQQQTAGVGELLGKHVTATTLAADGTAIDVSGVVTGVRFGAEGAVLELDTGQSVRAADVTRITTPEKAGDGAGDTAAAKTANSAKTAGTAASGCSGGSCTARRPPSLLPWLSLDGAFHL